MLYREIKLNTTRWHDLFGSDPDHLPNWSRHVRILNWERPAHHIYFTVMIDFRPLFPVLGRLGDLRQIEMVDRTTNIIGPLGLDLLTARVPSLEILRWAEYIYIDETTEVR